MAAAHQHQPNIRTLYNFPMQTGGAEMLRLATWRMCEAGIVPIMLIYDGILLEETDVVRDGVSRSLPPKINFHATR